MSKKNKNHDRKNAEREKMKVKSEIRIPDDVRKFASLNFKKFKKKNGDLYDGKKELKKGFYQELNYYLPATIEFLVKFGYIRKPEIIETKASCFEKFYDDDYLSYLTKQVKKDDDLLNEIKLLPIILQEVYNAIVVDNTKRLAADPNASQMSTDELCDIIKAITKSKFKALTKEGIEDSIAFDILMIAPSKKAWKYSKTFRLKNLLNTCYEHAKTKKVPFSKIIDMVILEDDIAQLITVCLSEKKEKFGNLNDNQKQLYTDITSWCFDTMEKMSKDDILAILDNYVSARRNDDSRGNDGNRRYSLSGLSEVDYPKIVKVINSMIAENEGIRKYL